MQYDVFRQGDCEWGAKLFEFIRLTAVPLDKENWGTLFTDFEYRRSSVYNPVYKRGPGNKEMLYGFVELTKNGEPRIFLSIHSIGFRNIVQFHHEPTCSIETTPAYEKWWRAIYCSAPYVEEALKVSIASDAKKACSLSSGAPSSSKGPSVFGDIKRCGKAEALKAIERATKVSRESKGPQYLPGQCSSKWKQLAEDISNKYSTQYPPSLCDGKTVDEIIKRARAADDAKASR